MPHYLLVYDQRSGRLVADIEEFGEDDADGGVQRRFALEREHRADPSIEVVLLGADSADQLKVTHRRYFMTPSEIAASA